jgi:uncharacterized membrane protein
MSLSNLILLSIITVIVFAWANWWQRKTRELGEVTLIPTTMLQLIALVAFVVLAAHLISTLTGFTFPRRHLL